MLSSQRLCPRSCSRAVAFIVSSRGMDASRGSARRGAPRRRLAAAPKASFHVARPRLARSACVRAPARSAGPLASRVADESCGDRCGFVPEPDHRFVRIVVVPQGAQARRAEHEAARVLRRQPEPARRQHPQDVRAREQRARCRQRGESARRRDPRARRRRPRPRRPGSRRETGSSRGAARGSPPSGVPRIRRSSTRPGRHRPWRRRRSPRARTSCSRVAADS